MDMADLTDTILWSPPSFPFHQEEFLAVKFCVKDLITEKWSDTKPGVIIFEDEGYIRAYDPGRRTI